MPVIHKLTETQVRKASCTEGVQTRLADGGGLYCVVSKTGTKTWSFLYRADGKQKTKVIGYYPDLSLDDARKAAARMRESVDDGEDVPDATPRDFEYYGKQVIAKKVAIGLSPETIRQARFVLGLLKPICKTDMRSLKAGDINRALQGIASGENRYKCSVLIREACRAALADEVLKADPSLLIDKDLKKRPQTDGYAHLSDRRDIGQLLVLIREYRSHLNVGEALELALRMAVRPGELRLATWADVNLTRALFRIPAARAKTRTGRDVPLSRQSLAVFERLKALRAEDEPTGLLFPSLRSSTKPISDMAMNAALKGLGFGHDDVVVHGFRKIFSSQLHASGEFPSEWIERALGHKDANKIRATYNKHNYTAEAVRLMQWWSDDLDRMAVAFETARAFT